MDYFQGQSVFITGGTGFLGTTLVHKLFKDTGASTIYLLVRGGEKRLWERYSELLPSDVYQRMHESKRIIAWEGDISLPGLGLSETAKATLATSMSIVIHCASSINLRHSLERIAPEIIYPTLELAELALASTSLKRFVYVSTAYANAHLHQMHDGIETEVLEQIYPLREIDMDTSALELADLRKRGTTPEYKFHDFPAAYCYAKHLTERLLLSRFQAVGRDLDLLIVRPAIIGPALAEPVRGFQVVHSAPATGVSAALVACSDWNVKFASRFPNPETDATLDEVPVDVVVNRLLMHTAKGSSGCVHAVAGQQRMRFDEIYERIMSLRRLPWHPRARFLNVSWHSKTLSPVARTVTIIGTSYQFDEASTRAVWEEMSSVERETWPLFLRSYRDQYDVAGMEARTMAARGLLQWWFGKKKGLPQWLTSFALTLLIRG